MTKNVLIQLRFGESTKYGVFNDALYFLPEDFSALSEEEVDALCQTRLDDWMDTMSLPVLSHVETLEELQDLEVVLQAQLDEVHLKISQL